MSNLIPSNKRNNDLDKKHKDIFDIEKFFESLFTEAFLPSIYGSGNIKADIMENEREYLLEAELPGVNKEEIRIDLRDDKLTISVQKNEEVNIEKENYVRRERKSGSYSRVFHIPNVKEEGIKARFENGILKVTLPKQEERMIKKKGIQIE